MSESVLIASTAKLTRQQLAEVPTPQATATHRPIPHAEVVEALVETLSFAAARAQEAQGVRLGPLRGAERNDQGDPGLARSISRDRKVSGDQEIIPERLPFARARTAVFARVMWTPSESKRD